MPSPASGFESRRAHSDVHSMERRKVQITRDQRRCYWEGDLIALLKRDHDFELTGKVHSMHIIVGWLPADRLEDVRAMPEVAYCWDDFPYLTQETS